MGVTTHPTAEWIARQLTEACGWDQAPTYLLRDRDRVYGQAFTGASAPRVFASDQPRRGRHGKKPKKHIPLKAIHYADLITPGPQIDFDQE